MEPLSQEYAYALSERVYQSEERISIHPLSYDATLAWEQLKINQVVKTVQPIPLDTEVLSTAVRFVCISDTHSCTTRMKYPIPYGDVLIHAGDFTQMGDISEVKKFNIFLGSLPHKHKVVIAGNHELGFEDPYAAFVTPFNRKKFGSKPDEHESQNKSNLLTCCHYLQDSGVEVYGIKIYGTPWQPRYGNWEFNLDRGQACLDKWNLIPKDVDVLVTHSPPTGHGDFCNIGVRAGCVELLSTVQRRVKPKYHVFGHIHEGYGITTDDRTIFINASICNRSYTPVNPPIIFDLPLPEGQSKS